MRGHPDRKEIIDGLTGFQKKNSEYIRNHIENCNECRDFAVSINNILQKSDNENLTPSGKAERGIMSMLNDSAIKQSEPNRKIFLRPVFAALVFVAAASAIFIYTRQHPDSNKIKIPLILSANSGEINYNNLLLSKEKAISDGIVFIKPNSSAILHYNSVFSIKIAENTEMKIAEATVTKNNGDNIYNVSLEMIKGTLMAEPDHSIRKSFIIKTPHAVFEALGTKFILSAAKDYSRIIVITGKVRIIGLMDGKIIIANPGDGFICSNTVTGIIIDPGKEIIQFNALFSKTKQNSNARQIQTVREEPDAKETGNAERISDESRKEKSEIQRETRNLKKEMQKNRRKEKSGRQ